MVKNRHASIGIWELVMGGRALKCPVLLAQQNDLSRSSTILVCGLDQGSSPREEVLGQGAKYSPAHLHYSLHLSVVLPNPSTVEGHVLGADTHPSAYYTYKTCDLRGKSCRTAVPELQVTLKIETEHTEVPQLSS